MVKDRFIRFDWAAKRMLRDKANFGVLEGLITVLLKEKVTIEEILESEANQDYLDDKFNRVDIKAKNSKGEIILVEIQQTRELHYLERILFGVAKSITEHINLGDSYEKVKKVYSISILYFDLGKGQDYLYHGQTTFKGVHTNDTLQITTKEKNVIQMKAPEDVFPEYFLIRVNEFNQVATTPLEEWMEYLKSGKISDNTQVPGLQEAREKLQYMMMSKAEQQSYDRHVDAIVIQNDVISTAQKEGRAEGLAEGRAEGLAEGRAEGLAEGRAEGLAEGRAEGRAEGEKTRAIAIAQKFITMGIPLETIAQGTGLSIDELHRLL